MVWCGHQGLVWPQKSDRVWASACLKLESGNVRINHWVAHLSLKSNFLFFFVMSSIWASTFILENWTYLNISWTLKQENHMEVDEIFIKQWINFQFLQVLLLCILRTLNCILQIWSIIPFHFIIHSNYFRNLGNNIEFDLKSG